MGFEIGTQVNVRVKPAFLILTAQEPEQEPDVQTTLRRVCGKLSARKQQITEFIQVIAEGTEAGRAAVTTDWL